MEQLNCFSPWPLPSPFQYPPARLRASAAAPASTDTAPSRKGAARCRLYQGGLLQLTGGPPIVQGANLKRRAANYWTAVRYYVLLVDLAGTQLNASSWSSWAWVGERSTVTWQGDTWFRANWRGL